MLALLTHTVPTLDQAPSKHRLLAHAHLPYICPLVRHLSLIHIYYNAFIATWQKQSGRFTFTSNYSFSKNLGCRDGQTSNGNGDGSSVWPYGCAQNYGCLLYTSRCV